MRSGYTQPLRFLTSLMWMGPYMMSLPSFKPRLLAVVSARAYLRASSLFSSLENMQDGVKAFTNRLHPRANVLMRAEGRARVGGVSADLSGGEGRIHASFLPAGVPRCV